MPLVGIRICVCGGRRFTDWRTLTHALNDLSNNLLIECIIHDGAVGAARMAGIWAQLKQDTHITVFRPDRMRHPWSARQVCNQRMLTEGKPGMLIAAGDRAKRTSDRFTEDMVRRATQAGVKVWRIA